jgi:hypothetical protein
MFAEPPGPATPFLSEWQDPEASAMAEAIVSVIDEKKMVTMTPSQQCIIPKIIFNPSQLILGPPGTGKTHFLASAMLFVIEAARRRQRDCIVLVTAFTHMAVEGLLTKLVELQAAMGFTDFPELWKLAEWKGARAPPSITVKSISPNGIDPRRLPPHSVIGGTVWSIRKAFSKFPPFAQLLIIDEATQLPILDSSLALSALDIEAGGRLILAGDPYQLSPIVQSVVPEISESNDSDGAAQIFPPVHESIFVALSQWIQKKYPESVNRLCSQLNENFRMNESLTRFAGDLFYGPEYRAVKPTACLEVPPADHAPQSLCRFVHSLLHDTSRSLILVKVRQDGRHLSFGPSHIECQLAALVATCLFDGLRGTACTELQFWRDKLSIITPQHIQRLSVRAALSLAGFYADLMRVDTVEKMQGTEADVVVVCYSMWHVEQLQSGSEFAFDCQRINVAITRARVKCIFIALEDLFQPSPATLASNRASRGFALLKHLEKTCLASGSYFEV